MTRVCGVIVSAFARRWGVDGFKTLTVVPIAALSDARH